VRRDQLQLHTHSFGRCVRNCQRRVFSRNRQLYQKRGIKELITFPFRWRGRGTSGVIAFDQIACANSLLAICRQLRSCLLRRRRCVGTRRHCNLACWFLGACVENTAFFGQFTSQTKEFHRRARVAGRNRPLQSHRNNVTRGV